jgi:hypothetical protein
MSFATSAAATAMMHWRRLLLRRGRRALLRPATRQQGHLASSAAAVSLRSSDGDDALAAPVAPPTPPSSPWLVVVAAAADELVAATTDDAATLEAKPSVMAVPSNEVCVTGQCCLLGLHSVFRTLGHGNNNDDALVAPVAPTRPPSSPRLVSVDAAADEVVAATADDAAIDLVS